MAEHHASELFGPSGTPTVAIVGAGMGGISAGVLLRRAGIESFTIYEKSARVGGTWWDNQYPGAEVDVDSYVYSFPFKRHDWTRTHARQAELHRYLEETVDDFDLAAHLRFRTGVTRAEWDDDRHLYRLTLTTGEETECHVLISAVGFLNVPHYPDWPGLEDFRGPSFHTSRWEHQHDLRGKRIAVVGTGSTASQLVPALQPVVSKLLVFQREPGWVLPKGDHDYTTAERRRLHNPLVHRYRRAKWYWGAEKRLWNGSAYRPGTPVHTAAEEAARQYIAKAFEDRPDLIASMTPSYPFWGKRTIFSSDFYPALKQPNVEVVPRAVSAVTRQGVVDVDGVEHPVDALVLATGFQPTNYLAHLEVVGRSGESIQKYWDGEPRAFLGVTVPTFPNFYMLYGPGTNGGEIALNLRNQAAYARRAIKRMIRDGVTAIEVKRSWADPYHAWLQSKMADTAWAVSNNYFTTSTGKVVTQWPFSALDYGALLKTLGRPSETTRCRGVPAKDVSDSPIHGKVLQDAVAEEPLQHERW
jgi:cation diffusion facilitator CzcD-associated flavoprotein CzcO